MSAKQSALDCPNPLCAAPGALALCMQFLQGFGLQVGSHGMEAARWDDTHCLVCGYFSSPFAGMERKGRDLAADAEWLRAVDHALVQARGGGLAHFLLQHDLGTPDLIAMRRAVQGLRDLHDMAAARPDFPQIGLLHVRTEANLPPVFGLAHGEAESAPFERKVRVLGRLLGARSAETTPRHCMGGDGRTAWYFYGEASFVGLLCLEPNRDYRGSLTIDGCLDRLLHA